MNTQAASVLHLILALVLANLPFASLKPNGLAGKPSPARNALGWLACYGVWMAIARALASSGGDAAPASWQLWAISAALFAVLAFPGIVWRYLLRA